MYNIKKEYQKRKKEIKKRLKEFSEVNKDDYFYELCFCILTPQSNAYKCDECVNILKKKDFRTNSSIDIKKILQSRTRFYKNKSNYLYYFWDNKDEIFSSLKNIKNRFDKRDFLVENVKGLGLKEASHFLRNIGVRNLAILDRHILKNLVLLKVIDEIPKSMNKANYLDIEKKFLGFSKKIKIPMDELDLLFWSIETGKVFK